MFTALLLQATHGSGFWERLAFWKKTPPRASIQVVERFDSAAIRAKKERRAARAKMHGPMPDDLTSYREEMAQLFARHSDDSAARLAPTTTITSSTYNEGMMTVVMDKATSGYMLNWSAKGPFPSNKSMVGAYASDNVPVGQVKAFLQHPSDANTVLMGMAFSGIWKTTNATSWNGSTYGTSWSPVADWAASTSISSMAWDAGAPGTVAYASTSTIPSVHWGISGGILRSDNGGDSWISLASTRSNTSIDTWQQVWSVVSYLDESGVSNVYAGTKKGGFRSTDRGNTWIEMTGLPKMDVLGFGEHPSIRGKIFATVASAGGMEIHVSSNGGKSWSMAAALPLAKQARFATGVQFGKNSNYAYVAVIENDEPALFWSKDAGASWSRVELVDEEFSTFGGHHLAMQVDQNNPTVVALGGDVMAFVEIQPSTGKGKCHGSSTQSVLGYNAGLHADIYAFSGVLWNSNSMLVGTDGGVFRLDNIQSFRTNNAMTSHAISQNLATGLVFAGDATSTGAIGAGFQDCGSWLMNTSNQWTKTEGGDGFGFSFGADETRMAWMGNSFNVTTSVGGATAGIGGGPDWMQPNPIMRARNSSGELGAILWNNSAGGVAWVPMWSTAGSVDMTRAINLGFTSGYPRSIGIDPLNMGNVIIGYSGADNAPRAAWFKLGQASPQAEQGEILVRGGQYPSGTCGGADYSLGGDILPPATTPDMIAAVTFDPKVSGKAYLAYDRFANVGRPPMARIWVTDDYRVGNPIWRPIGCRETGFPDIRVRDMAVDPQNPDVVFAATYLGLYVSLDGGATWGRRSGGSWNTFNIGPANTDVRQIRIIGRKIYLFTFGRGVWVADLPSAPTVNMVQSPVNGGYSSQTVEVSASSQGSSIASVQYILNGQSVAVVAASPWKTTLPVHHQSKGLNRLEIVTKDARGLKTVVVKEFQNSAVSGAGSWLPHVIF